MIPASYLFKDIYHQHWEEPDAPIASHHNRHFLDGLVSPLTGAIQALLSRRRAPLPRRARLAHD